MQIKSIIAGMVLLCAITANVAQAGPISGQGTWESTLLGRDINLSAVAATSSDTVYLYDSTLNVTWLRDANVNGQMDWNTAMAWAANLVTGTGSDAISDWRLPTMAPDPNVNFSYDGTTAYGYNAPADSSEMASLFYRTLGNKAFWDVNGNPQVDFGLSNSGSFKNFQSNGYWSGTEYPSMFIWNGVEDVLMTPYSWDFFANDGYQLAALKEQQFFAMAIRDGDVATVPEPGTYTLMLAALGLLGVMSRRRKQNVQKTDRFEPKPRGSVRSRWS